MVACFAEHGAPLLVSNAARRRRRGLKPLHAAGVGELMTVRVSGSGRTAGMMSDDE